MGSYGEITGGFVFNPSESVFVSSDQMEKHIKPVFEPAIGEDFDFDPAESKLVPKTITTSLRRNKENINFDFNPASCKLVPKKEEVFVNLHNSVTGGFF